jgi:hypothetical protein
LRAQNPRPSAGGARVVAATTDIPLSCDDAGGDGDDTFDLASGVLVIARYYGPTWRLNGNTAKDIIYDGTALEDRFETVQFE